ncbi:MAG: L,D-transpeptidase family protein [Eubacteriales bacterium]|nr:L,D-transpeptidase family protein [Eubacteriales bacterium]
MKKNKTRVEKNSRSDWKLRIIAGVLVVFILALAGYLLYLKLYYGNRWYQGTTVNGVDVSGQTLEESKKTMISMHQDYSLHISGRDQGTLTIGGEEIDYQFNIGSDFDKKFEEQHEKLQIFPKESQYKAVEYDVSYDVEQLTKLVKNSALIQGDSTYTITKPVSAHVEFSKTEQKYTLVEEVLGNKIIVKNLVASIEDVLHQAREEMDLTEEETYPDIYKAPAVFSDDEDLQKELDAYNHAALRYIVWDMGEGVTEQITPVELSEWLQYKNGEMKYDNNAIQEWVEAFCLKYKTVGKDRMITSHTGKKVKIKGGDYGWQLDYEETLKQAKKAVKKEIDTSVTNAYLENPTEENKEALTIRKEVKYANTAFQKDYEDFAVDWDTQNYIEISIKDQMVYVFRKGKVKFSCRCITGRPVEGRMTPTGAYYIKEHRTEYTLTGDDYETPVKNWVRITWTGTGFHPATWQPWSRWTKDLYKTKGSHGCINLSVEDAQKIYDMTSYREAVFIH